MVRVRVRASLPKGFRLGFHLPGHPRGSNLTLIKGQGGFIASLGVIGVIGFRGYRGSRV